jgi:hypothetical protein
MGLSSTRPDLKDLLSKTGEIESLFLTIRNVSNVNELRTHLDPLKHVLEGFQSIMQQEEPKTYSPQAHTPSTGFQKAMYDGFKHEYQVIVTRGDGSCFYRAVSQAMFGFEDLHPFIRLVETNHILAEEEALRGLHGPLNVSYEELLTKTKTLSMNPTEGWGTEANTFILSEIIQRPIIVHQSSFEPSRKGANMLYSSNPLCANKKPFTLMLRQAHFQPMMPRHSNVSVIPTRLTAFPTIGHRYIASGDPADSQIDVDDDELALLQEVQRDEYAIIQIQARFEKMRMARDRAKLTDVQKLSKSTEDEDTRSRSPRSPLLPRSPDKGESLRTQSVPQNPKTKSSNSINESQSGVISMSPTSCRGQASSVKSEDSEEDVSPISPLSRFASGEQDNARNQETFGDLPTTETRTNENVNIQKLEEKIDTLTSMITGIMKKQGTVFIPIPAIEDVNFEALNSVEAILTKFPFLQRSGDTESPGFDDFADFHIICTICHDPFDKTKSGVFTYVSNEGTDFKKRKQPREFRNLKIKLQKHIASEKHMKIADKERESAVVRFTRIQKNHEAGKICGKWAYTAIKLDQSLLRYEDYIAIAASMNMAVGEKNHGRKFARELAHSFYICLHQRLHRYLTSPSPATGRPPPFAVIADKYTPNRTAGQIVGIIAFIDGKMRDVNIDFPQVKEHGGLGIACSIYESLRGVYGEREIKTRYGKYNG